MSLSSSQRYVLTNVGRDVSDPKGFVIEQWISLLGSWINFLQCSENGATHLITAEDDFPVYGVDGARSIPWTTLPFWLARRRQYIDGCPEDCLPEVVGDYVAESSSPYNYNLAQTQAITRAFVNGEISLRMRPEGKRFQHQYQRRLIE